MSTIRTVDRAFAILRYVSQHPDGVGVSMIATHLGLAKSTISRLLATMQQWEVVEKTPSNQFRIGSEPARWISHQPFSNTLGLIARPALQMVADETGEATTLCVLDSDQLVYLDHIQSRHDIQVRDWRGEKLPLHVTSAGKVLLAYARPELQRALLQRPLVAYTDKTIVDSTVLEQQLQQIRTQGVAVADEEFAEGIIGIAVPLLIDEQDVVAALCVYGPKFRLDALDKQQEIIEIMQHHSVSLRGRYSER